MLNVPPWSSRTHPMKKTEISIKFPLIITRGYQPLWTMIINYQWPCSIGFYVFSRGFPVKKSQKFPLIRWWCHVMPGTTKASLRTAAASSRTTSTTPLRDRRVVTMAGDRWSRGLDAEIWREMHQKLPGNPRKMVGKTSLVGGIIIPTLLKNMRFQLGWWHSLKKNGRKTSSSHHQPASFF